MAVDMVQLRKEREKDITESLKIIGTYADWVRKTKNSVWSKQQAGLFNSVYAAINENWRKGMK